MTSWLIFCTHFFKFLNPPSKIALLFGTILGVRDVVSCESIIPQSNRVDELTITELTKMDAFPGFSVIIPTHNRKETLITCLEALGRQSYPMDKLEVFVCDDGSTDNTVDALVQVDIPFDMTYLRQSNSGPAAARNMGIRRAKNEYLLILNDDAILESDVLAIHARTHLNNSDKKISVLGAFRLLPEHTRTMMGWMMDRSIHLFAYSEMRSGELHKFQYYYTCNISVRREAVLDVGMFDERFTGPAAEDLELGYRLQLQGFEILYDENCIAWHDHAVTPDSFFRVWKVRSEGAVTLMLLHPHMIGGKEVTLKALEGFRSERAQRSKEAKELCRTLWNVERKVSPDQISEELYDSLCTIFQRIRNTLVREAILDNPQFIELLRRRECGATATRVGEGDHNTSAKKSVGPTERPEVDLNEKGMVEFSAGRILRAKGLFERVTASTPDSAKAFFNLGKCHEAMSEFKNAGEAFARSLEIEPGNLDTQKRLAAVLVAQGLMEEAMEILFNLLKLSPDDPETLNMLGQVCEITGYSEEAEIFYLRSRICNSSSNLNMTNPDQEHTSELGSFSITWEGPFFSNQSLANVNRGICSHLVEAGLDISLFPIGPHQFSSEEMKRNRKLADVVSKKATDAQIHILHQWPPNLKPPSTGKWVVIQPWEFGSLPIEWAKVFATDVDEMWVYTDYVKEVYLSSGVPAERVFVIPCGFDPAIFHPAVNSFPLRTKKSFKFLFVGGTIFRKGIDLLLRAYVGAFTSEDDVCLVIKDMGGDSFYKGQTFKSKIEGLQKKENAPSIEYLERNLSESKIANLYKTCNVLVHPYRGEGFGMPILESMACGTPAIVTGGGAAMDFCNGSNSILVSASKKILPKEQLHPYQTVSQAWVYEVDVRELAMTMKFATENTEVMAALGIKAASDALDKWTWKHAANKVLIRLKELHRKSVTEPPLRFSHKTGVSI